MLTTANKAICSTCKGKKTLRVVVDGENREKRCPRCGGTGKAGIRTK